MRFNISDYQGKYVMHCSTQEESDLFREYLHDAGKRWRGGKSYLSTDYWNDYKEQFCYNFCAGTFADVSYYRREGYTILEFSHFEFDDEPEVQVDQFQLNYGDLFAC